MPFPGLGGFFLFVSFIYEALLLARILQHFITQRQLPWPLKGRPLRFPGAGMQGCVGTGVHGCAGEWVHWCGSAWVWERMGAWAGIPPGARHLSTPLKV